MARLTVPFLAVYRDRDRVIPVQRSVAVLLQALQEAPSGDVNIKIIPDADHDIRTPASPEFAPEYVELLANWVKQRAR